MLIFEMLNAFITVIPYLFISSSLYSLTCLKRTKNKFCLQVPTSACSEECDVGYKKTQDGIQDCCFNCTICPNGTYINSTGK